MPIKGLEEARQKLQKLEDIKQVSLGQLLTPEFVSANTKFSNLDDMFQNSGFKADTAEDFAAIPDDEWDQFIASSTNFQTWEEMQKAAFQAFLARVVKS